MCGVDSFFFFVIFDDAMIQSIFKLALCVEEMNKFLAGILLSSWNKISREKKETIRLYDSYVKFND